MAADDKQNEPAELFFEGDSLEVLKSFAKPIKQAFGEDLRRLQKGVLPKSFRPMASIGRGVAELKQKDANGWYRVIYLGVDKGRLYILHSFVKKGRKTPKKDLDTAESRLKDVRARQLKEKQDAKRRK